MLRQRIFTADSGPQGLPFDRDAKAILSGHYNEGFTKASSWPCMDLLRGPSPRQHGSFLSKSPNSDLAPPGRRGNSLGTSLPQRLIRVLETRQVSTSSRTWYHPDRFTKLTAARASGGVISALVSRTARTASSVWVRWSFPFAQASARALRITASKRGSMLCV